MEVVHISTTENVGPQTVFFLINNEIEFVPEYKSTTSINALFSSVGGIFTAIILSWGKWIL